MQFIHFHSGKAFEKAAVEWQHFFLGLNVWNLYHSTLLDFFGGNPLVTGGFHSRRASYLELTIKPLLYDAPIPRPKWFSSPLALVLVQSIEARCWVENEDVLEQRREAMLQLHLTDEQVGSLLRYDLYWKFDSMFSWLPEKGVELTVKLSVMCKTFPCHDFIMQNISVLTYRAISLCAYNFYALILLLHSYFHQGVIQGIPQVMDLFILLFALRCSLHFLFLNLLLLLLLRAILNMSQSGQYAAPWTGHSVIYCNFVGWIQNSSGAAYSTEKFLKESLWFNSSKIAHQHKIMLCDVNGKTSMQCSCPSQCAAISTGMSHPCVSVKCIA